MNDLASSFISSRTLLCLFLAANCLAAQTNEDAPVSRASERGKIVVRLLAPSPEACLGQATIDLEAVLTNTTEESVELSADGVVHDVSFRKYVGERPGEGTGMLLDFKPAHWISIAGHQSVVIPFTEPIKGKLFASAGLFSVGIDFAAIFKNREQYSKFPSSVRSNNAFFLLAKCNGESRPIAAPH